MKEPPTLLESGHRVSISNSVPEHDTLEEFSLGKKGTLIFLALTILTLMVALDGTSISVALPIIANDLHGTSLEAFWSGTSFLLCSTVFQPTFASLSNIFGRKSLTLAGLAFFLAGTIVAGVSQDFTVLIAGRCVQGVGGGGLIALSEIILTDLVPLRLRGLYFAYLGSAWSVGSVIGPILGGGFAQNISWRWIFYINFPFVGLGLLLILFFLDLRLPEGNLTSKLRTVDYGGTVLFVASLTSFLIPLTWAGLEYPWSSWNTITPLVIGIIGLMIFGLYEYYVAKDPMIPCSVFQTRTSSVVYICTTVLGLLLWCLLYYLPLYYQAVLEYDPVISGVAMLPETFTVAPTTTIAALVMAKTGRYRWAVWTGWMITVLGLGLLTLLEPTSSIPQWVFLNLVPGIGLGLVITSMAYALQAAVSAKDLPIAVAMFSFFRGLGQALGVAIGEAIFQNQMEYNLPKHGVPRSLVETYSKNAASAVVGIKAMKDDRLKLSIQQAYADSLRTVWISCCAIAAFAFLLSFFVKEHKLDRHHLTSQGLRKD